MIPAYIVYQVSSLFLPIKMGYISANRGFSRSYRHLLPGNPYSLPGYSSNRNHIFSDIISISIYRKAISAYKKAISGNKGAFLPGICLLGKCHLWQRFLYAFIEGVTKSPHP